MRKMRISDYCHESYCLHCADNLWCEKAEKCWITVCRKDSCGAVRELREKRR